MFPRWSGTKGDVQSAMRPTCPTSLRRQQLIFTLNWPRRCWSKLEETPPPPFSPSPQPAGATRGPTETCTCVPLRLACMLLAFTTLSHPTGCPGPTLPMCPGSLVRGIVVCEREKQFDRNIMIFKSPYVQILYPLSLSQVRPWRSAALP